MKRVLLLLLIILGFCIQVWADSNTAVPLTSVNPAMPTFGNTAYPSQLFNSLSQEDAARWYEQGWRNFVSTVANANACLGTTGVGLSMTPVACVAYNLGYRGTETGPITFSNGMTTWVAMDENTSGNNPNLPNFTRVGSTHYLIDTVDANQPVMAADSQLLMKVVTAGGSITAVTDLRNVSPSSDGVVNVKVFGARGDGITDDTTALQLAANAAGSYSCLYLPAGNYLIKQDLNLTRNSLPFCIRGADASNTTITCQFATPNQGNCVDASGADGYSISNITIQAGTSSANAPKVALLLARTGAQGYGHTLTNVWTKGYGTYSIYDYGAEIGNWIGVRSQPGAVVFSTCNHAVITSRYQSLVAPQTSMSTVNIFGGQFWAGGSQANRCGIIFDASCPSNAYAAIHDINIYSAFFGEEVNGASTATPTAGLCDVAGSSGAILTAIGVYGVRMEAGDSGAHYAFADFSGSALAQFNFYQDTLATSAATDSPVLKVGGCIDSSHLDVTKTGAGVTGGTLAIQAPCGRNNDFVNVTHALVSTVLFKGLSGLGEPASRFSYSDGTYGYYDAGGFEASALPTALNGTTAGTVNWAEPAHGLGYHLVTLYFQGYQNNTTTGQTITYPIQFDQAPSTGGGCPAGINVTSGVSVVLPVSMASPFTGQCILSGQ